ncbi:Superfamily II DNA or RNA helicase [Propionibacterium cyclohexanicum]|uniref:Superfamily II DNA or RNA helicase n=1 Tax=Propionibacterium cyclohexanicum TaxID=64702 RepID=A0A1H9T3Q5_9ACTN|nr:DEAD/DEAH box helicase [Propionibacterium cyclohexanicum]SER91880.1 Superfamily II DNA or RNA helicase [Propionibacterium cyclohexanicum]
MSSSAFEHISPAFPGRAPWGTSGRLRAWQSAALELYRATGSTDFLTVATPGAGKTTFALRVAAELLSARRVQRITVVCPTEHLKAQWAEAAAKVGIQLDPGLGGSSRGGRSRQYDGVVVTYAGVAARVFHHRARTENFKTLVIFDEIHHAGDALSWGDAIAEAFAPAVKRLALTGTPFRSDETPIPFVHYERGDDGALHSCADYSYGYADALRDHVVRPVVFMTYGGQMRWRTRAGDEVEADLAAPMTKDLTANAWRTALDPKGSWIPSVLAAANTRLSQVRNATPDAGGLVIASDRQLARAYAKILHSITGEAATVVLSDDAGSSKKIDEFAAGDSRWMVAVRMVSEGVDVPRLSVGVYATATSTALFFAQAVGRFVRTRRRGEVATIFLPTVPLLLSHASLLERERDHVIGKPKHAEDELWAPEEALIEQANRTEQASDDLLGSFEAIASSASFDHVLFDAQDYGLPAEPTSRDEADYLGLPGLLEPEQVATLLRERQRRQLSRQERQDRKDKVSPEVSLHRALETARKELNSLVSQYARTAGMPHSHVHAAVRRECGGPALAGCTTDQVRERTETLRRWLLHPGTGPR